MIFKAQRRGQAVNPELGWIYVDGIRKVQTYGALLDVDGTDVGLFRDAQGLADAVDRMWGPGSVRQFDDELWPDFPDEAFSVVCVRLDRNNGETILALVNDNAWLLDDSGNTIDRLR